MRRILIVPLAMLLAGPARMIAQDQPTPDVFTFKSGQSVFVMTAKVRVPLNRDYFAKLHPDRRPPDSAQPQAPPPWMAGRAPLERAEPERTTLDRAAPTRRIVPPAAREFQGPVEEAFRKERAFKQEDFRRGNRYLSEVAEHSGARPYKAETLKNVDQAFAHIAHELRQQDALSYYPDNSRSDGAYRKLRVVVARPDVAVRSRKGYRAVGAPRAKEDK